MTAPTSAGSPGNTVVVRLDDGGAGSATIVARLAPQPPAVHTVTATTSPLAAARVVNVDAVAPVWSGGGPPTGGAGGVLSGTYPNPGFAVNMATQAELDAHKNSTNPHPQYDDIPSLLLKFENGMA